MMIEIGSRFVVDHHQVAGMAKADKQGIQCMARQCAVADKMHFSSNSSIDNYIEKMNEMNESNDVECFVLLENGMVIPSDFPIEKVKAIVNRYKRNLVVFYHDVGEMPVSKVDGAIQRVREQLAAQDFNVDVVVPIRSVKGGPSASRIETAHIE